CGRDDAGEQREREERERERAPQRARRASGKGGSVAREVGFRVAHVVYKTGKTRGRQAVVKRFCKPRQCARSIRRAQPSWSRARGEPEHVLERRWLGPETSLADGGVARRRPDAIPRARAPTLRCCERAVDAAHRRPP